MDAVERWRVLRLHVEDQVPLAALARHTGIGLRTLERWKARYRASGVEGLRNHPSSTVRGRHVPAELTRVIEGLALTKPRPSIATLRRALAPVCTKNGWALPTYSVVRSIVVALDPGMVTLALEGAASYRDKFEILLRRQAERPNEMWQADHTMLDVLVVGTGGKPARPWLSTVIDDCSRALCGYFLFTGAPSAANTALALRQAIWHKANPGWVMCGIPDVLYVDHGSDFTSHRLEQTALDLHLRIVHSAVARPQGRGKVERFFGTINTELLTTLPGHSVAGHTWPDPSLTLAQLDDAIGTFIRGYNERPHSELGISPKQSWLADGWMPRLPETLEALDGFLLDVAHSRTVRRDGIHFQGLRYLSPTLASYVGVAVTIRYDPRDVSEIRVYDRDTFVCTAVDPAHQSTTVSLKDIQAARNARRRELRGQINERIALVRPSMPDPPSHKPVDPPRPRLRIYEEDSP
jgi:putative transposase